MPTQRGSQEFFLTLCAICVSWQLAFSAVYAGTPAPHFDLPTEIRCSQPLAIRLVDLPPGATVQLVAERSYGWTKLEHYRSSVTVKADHAGVVDLTRQAPEPESKSSYHGVQPLGLFWSMTPSGSSENLSGDSNLITLTATIDSGSNQSATSGSWSHQLKLIKRISEVQEFPLGKEDTLEGAFLMTMPSIKPRPVVIILGGSEGGDSSARSLAPILASEGFAAIGFPYFSPAYGKQRAQFPSLPDAFEEIPLDRIELILDFIEKHPKLDAERVALQGVSKGGEFVLAASSRIHRFKAVAAFVPSDVIWEGWGGNAGPRSGFSFRGEPLPFVPYKGMGETIAKLNRGEKATMRIPHDAGRESFPERISKACIEVEKIESALMIVGGDADNIWDSGGMCKNIERDRQTAGLETLACISPTAGHYLSGHAFRPLAYAPEDAAFRTETFPKMLEFFREHLDLQPSY